MNNKHMIVIFILFIYFISLIPISYAGFVGCCCCCGCSDKISNAISDIGSSISDAWDSAGSHLADEWKRSPAAKIIVITTVIAAVIVTGGLALGPLLTATTAMGSTGILAAGLGYAAAAVGGIVAIDELTGGDMWDNLKDLYSGECDAVSSVVTCSVSYGKDCCEGLNTGLCAANLTIAKTPDDKLKLSYCLGNTTVVTYAAQSKACLDGYSKAYRIAKSMCYAAGGKLVEG